jgi:hypothetical protein
VFSKHDPVDAVIRNRSATVAGFHGLNRCRYENGKERRNGMNRVRANATGFSKNHGICPKSRNLPGQNERRQMRTQAMAVEANDEGEPRSGSM